MSLTAVSNAARSSWRTPSATIFSKWLKAILREPYLRNILPLTHAGSHYLLSGFEYPMRWWERLVPFYDVPFRSGEIERRFGPYFEIEKIAGGLDYSKWPPVYAAYLMTLQGLKKWQTYSS